MPENDGKKKMSPWAWVGIGCGGLVVVGIIVVALLVGMCNRKVAEFEDNPLKAAAELAVWANPDLELVDSNDEDGTITVKDKKTGKETTVDFEDAADGKFTIQSDGTTATFDGKEGTMTSEGPDGKQTWNKGGLEKMPKWFVVPEGVTNWRSARHSEQEAKVHGVVFGQSEETLEKLMEAFETSLQDAEFEKVSKTENNAFTMVNYADKSGGRTIAVLMTPGEKGLQVQMTYSAK